MKKLIPSLIITGFITGFSMMAYSQVGAQEIVEPQNVKVVTNTDSLASYTQFRADAQQKIINNDKDIAALKAKMIKGNAKADNRYHKKIVVLENKNDDLRKRIANYNYNEKDWPQFKQEFNHDMFELGKAFKGFTSKK
ncbi:hypothetical protein C3K47_12950 [Solitalea longa]|uniref:Uncharacterized protein n=1 Tax=Solitalea longa TaxID=2079460 RepID=A0A2S5A0I0_9SPHI|nr:hypothetical protein [Solitalea longa]POY36100.1 hypothetical protein C3K47_12950 [Solitalea longa]